MTNQEKAKQFLEWYAKSPNNASCEMLLSMLAFMTAMDQQACLNRIRALAEGKDE